MVCCIIADVEARSTSISTDILPTIDEAGGMAKSLRKVLL